MLVHECNCDCDVIVMTDKGVCMVVEFYKVNFYRIVMVEKYITHFNTIIMEP